MPYKIKDMEDSSKLFVFEKKEVLLIFVFVVLIASTAFTLGLRIGKGLESNEKKMTANSVEDLNLKSIIEEDAEKISLQKNDRESDDILDNEDESSLRLNDLDKKFKEVVKEKEGETQSGIDVINKPLVEQDSTSLKKRNLSGKFTIQLSSKDNRDAAIEFAEPFRAAGYDVIVNSAKVEGKEWYRISIGAFNSKIEANEFMQNENDLFQDKDYIIKQFK